ncbi:MAG TPA: hypothetical protein VG870_02320 [Chitinophagaceae bacterium]|nr:hypothetical protein [Chitinophagaceae bacterium]
MLTASQIRHSIFCDARILVLTGQEPHASIRGNPVGAFGEGIKAVT